MVPAVSPPESIRCLSNGRNKIMDETTLEKINRKQLALYIFRLSLFLFTIVFLAILIFLIKYYIFTASSNKGYVIFILQNFILSTLLFISSSYTKKENTKLAVLFDKASGTTKIIGIIVFIISIGVIHKLIHLILFKIFWPPLILSESKSRLRNNYISWHKRNNSFNKQ